MNDAPLQPVNLQEVKAAVFSLGGAKVVGPDGIPRSFYHKSWDIIKLDLLRVIQRFFLLFLARCLKNGMKHP